MSGLFLHSSNRLEVLAGELAKVLHTPLSSPLAPEIIAVQSKGMERWLSLQLATHDGIWANYRFPFPTALIRELLASLLGPVAESPLLVPENLTWRLMEILPAKLATPTYQQLAPYLHDHSNDDLRLWQLCGRIAETFDQYLVYRHHLLNAWEEGRPALRSQKPGPARKTCFQEKALRSSLASLRLEQPADLIQVFLPDVPVLGKVHQ